MKAVFYCRAPYKGNLTIFEQEQLLLNAIKTKPEYSLYAIYVDHQSEEDLDHRPAFSQLCKDAEKNIFHILFCLNTEILGLSKSQCFPKDIFYLS